MLWPYAPSGLPSPCIVEQVTATNYNSNAWNHIRSVSLRFIACVVRRMIVIALFALLTALSWSTEQSTAMAPNRLRGKSQQHISSRPWDLMRITNESQSSLEDFCLRRIETQTWRTLLLVDALMAIRRALATRT